MKKTLIAVATASALLLAGASASPAFAASSNGSVKGHVRTFTGKAIKNATVVVYKDGATVATKQSITTKTGRFEMALKPGTYRLIAQDSKKKYATSTSATTFTVSTGVAKRVNKKLYAASSITGRVTSDAGKRLSGITVTATGTNTLGVALPTATAKTDSTGAFYFKGLTAGSYDVAYTDSKGVYITEHYSPTPVAVGIGQKRTGTSVSLTPAAKITGRVFVNGIAADDSLGKVLATITNLATNEVSEAQVVDPTFKFHDVAPGDYKLTFAGDTSSSDFVTSTDFAYNGSTTIHIGAGTALTGLSANLTTKTGVATPTVTTVTVTPATVTAGTDTLSIAVLTRSYNAPTGAAVTLNYLGADHETSTLSAAGTATFSIPSTPWVGKSGSNTVVANVAAVPNVTAASTANGLFTVR